MRPVRLFLAKLAAALLMRTLSKRTMTLSRWHLHLGLSLVRCKFIPFPHSLQVLPQAPAISGFRKPVKRWGEKQPRLNGSHFKPLLQTDRQRRHRNNDGSQSFFKQEAQAQNTTHYSGSFSSARLHSTSVFNQHKKWACT